MAKPKPNPTARPWYRRLFALFTAAAPRTAEKSTADRKSRWQISGEKAEHNGRAAKAQRTADKASPSEKKEDEGLDDVLQNVDLDALLESAGFEAAEQASEPVDHAAQPDTPSSAPAEAVPMPASSQKEPERPAAVVAPAPAKSSVSPAAVRTSQKTVPAAPTGAAPPKGRPAAKPTKKWHLGSLFAFLLPRRAAESATRSTRASPSSAAETSGGSNLDALLATVQEKPAPNKPQPGSASVLGAAKSGASAAEKAKGIQESSSAGDFQPSAGQFIRKERRGSLEALEQAPALVPPVAVLNEVKKPVQKELTEAEKRRQREDEEALKEQAEKKRKEEDARRAKEIADAKKAPPPPKIVLRKKVTTWKNPITGLGSALRHFGLGKERNLIIENLATMLNAGLPLVDSLKTLRLETRNRAGRLLIQRILDRVESGTPLWRAMEQEEFFSPDALALVRIGEEAGNLAENMEYLAQQQEKDEALRSKVKMAMIYPAIVLVLMFIIIMGLGMFVLPNLVQVLFSLNVQLPLVTRLVIAFTELFSKHGKIILPGSIVFFAAFAILVKYTPLQIAFQWVTFRIPGIGTLLWEATIARFGVIVGGLLQAGVPLVDALRSLVEVTTTVAYQRFYQRLLEHILVGDSFSKSFAAMKGSEKLLPISVQQLVMTGERTGTLSKIMLKIASIYERKANDTAQKLPVILEPMLLLFIGALVGTIAFAIIIPIYSIVGSVNR